jgi:hypothetical protein
MAVSAVAPLDPRAWSADIKVQPVWVWAWAALRGSTSTLTKAAAALEHIDHTDAAFVHLLVIQALEGIVR